MNRLESLRDKRVIRACGGGRPPRASARASPCPGLTPFAAPRLTDRQRHVRRYTNGRIHYTCTSTSARGQREQRGGGGDAGAAGGTRHLTVPNVTRPRPRVPKLQRADAVRPIPPVCPNCTGKRPRRPGREGLGAAWQEAARRRRRRVLGRSPRRMGRQKGRDGSKWPRWWVALILPLRRPRRITPLVGLGTVGMGGRRVGLMSCASLQRALSLRLPSPHPRTASAPSSCPAQPAPSPPPPPPPPPPPKRGSRCRNHLRYPQRRSRPFPAHLPPSSLCLAARAPPSTRWAHC